MANIDLESNRKLKHNTFVETLKFEEDKELKKLIEIQEELEKKGINKENVQELTKDLYEKQKQRLENLYKEQIKELEIKLQNSKNKIIEIKNKLTKNENV